MCHANTGTDSLYKNQSTPCKICYFLLQTTQQGSGGPRRGQESGKGRAGAGVHLPEKALFTGASRVYSLSGRSEDARPSWATRSVKVVCWFPASSSTCLAVKQTIGIPQRRHCYRRQRDLRTSVLGCSLGSSLLHRQTQLPFPGLLTTQHFGGRRLSAFSCAVSVILHRSPLHPTLVSTIALPFIQR